MMHQILHHPGLSNLDLSSLASVATGAAHLPSELLGAFKRRAKNLPFFVEGSDIPCHPSMDHAYLYFDRVRAVRMRMFRRLSVHPRR
jgi:hypothetical protein